MRENTKIILWVVVVAFVITIFAVWGLDLQSGGMTKQQNLVGRVNGIPVTPQAYQSIYTQLAQQFRASADNADLTSAQQEMLRDRAWESIVSNIITSEQIERLGISVSDEEILNFIRTSPPPEVQQYFRDANGNFDFAAYQSALNNPDADWTAVEDLARQRIPVLKLNQYLMSQVHVSTAEVRHAFDEETVKLVARYVAFPIDQEDVGGWEPSESDIAAYYDKHTDRFRQPEKAALQIVRIPRLPADRDRSDLDYTAALVQKQAAGGEDFATLAKTYSESHTASVGGETGFLGGNQRDAAVMEALPAMKPGQVSEPIPTKDGVYIVQMIDSKKEKGETKYNMREIYMKLSAGPETVDSLSAVARDIEEQATASGDLAAAANARGVEVITAEPFAQGMPVPGLGFSPAVSRFAFSGTVGAISNVIADDAAFYVCKLVSRTPPSSRPLAEVTDAIRQTLVRDKKVSSAMLKANAFRRSAVVPEVPFEKVAAQYGYTIAKTDSFTAVQPVADQGPRSPFALAALSTPAGGVSPAVESGNAVYVIRVDGRKDPEEALFQARAPQIRDAMYRERVQAYVEHWYAQLREKSTIEDFRDQVL
ncbi:MAG TPA: SurA N-terminal domain-containing protein [Candidatus Krumholzibacteria bacterium]|nr:SurA N-terminal domain-containing protein [Candidatus Krumholzibacteria bacterium]